MKAKKTVSSDISVLIQNVKTLLKERKVTYKELATGIGISESGLKKIFSGADISLGRLSQVCKYVGVTLTEALQDQRSSQVDFTEKQQEEFLKAPALFNFFWLLAYERLSLDEAQIALKISTAEAFRLARKLDDLKLIRLLPNSRIRVPSIRAVNWTGSGRFLKKLYTAWSANLINDIKKPSDSDQELFIIRYLPMTEKTFREFGMALKDLESEFVRRSIHEMQTEPLKLDHVRWVTAADKRSWVTGQTKR